MAALAFLIAAAIGSAVVLMVERRSSSKLGSHPWKLHDTANMHVGVMASLAGFAFTGDQAGQGGGHTLRRGRSPGHYPW